MASLSTRETETETEQLEQLPEQLQKLRAEVLVTLNNIQEKYQEKYKGKYKKVLLAFTKPRQKYDPWPKIFQAWTPIKDQIGSAGANTIMSALGKIIVDALDDLPGKNGNEKLQDNENKGAEKVNQHKYGNQIEYDGFMVRGFLGGSTNEAGKIQHMKTLKALCTIGGSTTEAGKIQHMETLKALSQGKHNDDIEVLKKNLKEKLNLGDIYVLHDLGLDGNCDDFFALLQFSALKKMILLETNYKIHFVAVGGSGDDRKLRALAAKKFFPEITSVYVTSGAPVKFKIQINGSLQVIADNLKKTNNDSFDSVVELSDLSKIKSNDYLVVIGQCGGNKEASLEHVPPNNLTAYIDDKGNPIKGKDIHPFAAFGNMFELFDPIPPKVKASLKVHVMGPGFNVFGDSISKPGWDMWTQFTDYFSNPETGATNVKNTTSEVCPSYTVKQWRELFVEAEKNHQGINELHLVAIAQFFLTRYDSSFHSFTNMFGMTGNEQLNFEVAIASQSNGSSKKRDHENEFDHRIKRSKTTSSPTNADETNDDSMDIDKGDKGGRKTKRKKRRKSKKKRRKSKRRKSKRKKRKRKSKRRKRRTKRR